MSVYTYGAVLLLSLGGAWYQWSKPPSLTKGEEVVVLYGEENTIEGISWESEKDPFNASSISKKKCEKFRCPGCAGHAKLGCSWDGGQCKPKGG